MTPLQLNTKSTRYNEMKKLNQKFVEQTVDQSYVNIDAFTAGCRGFDTPQYFHIFIANSAITSMYFGVFQRRCPAKMRSIISKLPIVTFLVAEVGCSAKIHCYTVSRLGCEPPPYLP